jgi:hypothetical protein
MNCEKINLRTCGEQRGEIKIEVSDFCELGGEENRDGR